jgi:hypothetical protein
LEGPQFELEEYVSPLKIKKVNIGIEENPKIEIIGDYWENQIMEIIT